MVEGEQVSRPAEVKGERKRGLHLPYERVAEVVGLSADRLRRLLNTGKVEGEKQRKQGKGYPWRWTTSRQAVERYRASLKTAREYGMMGGRPKKQALGNRP